ncbi:MAG: ABC transporter substrate-binding protein [Filifactoraceae bacterium]
MKRSIRFGVLALALGLVFTGCTPKDKKDETDKGSSENKKVTVVLDWTPNTNHTGMYVALENGYYKEKGLDVEIIQPPESTALQLVASDKAQFGVSFQEEIALAISAKEPLPVKAVAGIMQHNDSGIISKKEKNIVSPKDMEGKTYASWDSPFEIAVLNNVLANDGGDFAKVNSVPNTVTDVVTALNTNVDAVWVYYSWDGIAAELAGLETNFIDFKGIESVLDFYTPVIATSDKLIKEDPEMVKAFVEATKKGYEFAIEKPEEAAKILVKHAPEISPELAKASQIYLADKYQADAPSWGVFNEDRWNAFYGWMEENGIVERSILGEGFTNEFIGN